MKLIQLRKQYSKAEFQRSYIIILVVQAIGEFSYRKTIYEGLETQISLEEQIKSGKTWAIGITGTNSWGEMSTR